MTDKQKRKKQVANRKKSIYTMHVGDLPPEILVGLSEREKKIERNKQRKSNLFSIQQNSITNVEVKGINNHYFRIWY